MPLLYWVVSVAMVSVTIVLTMQDKRILSFTGKIPTTCTITVGHWNDQIITHVPKPQLCRAAIITTILSQGGYEYVRYLYITIYWLSVSAIVLCDLLVFLVSGGTLLGAGGQSAISTPHLAAHCAGKRCDKHSTNSWKSWHLHRPIALNSNKTSRVTMHAVYCVWKDVSTTDSMLPRRWCAAANVRRGSTPTALLRKRSTSQASGRVSGAGWCPRTSRSDAGWYQQPGDHGGVPRIISHHSPWRSPGTLHEAGWERRNLH